MDSDKQEGGERRGGLFALFVDRPVLTLMVVAAAVLVGTVAFAKLPLRFTPEGATGNKIRVWIPVRNNRTPQEVRDTVARPLEELLRTIPGLEEVRSDSSSGNCRFTVELADHLDPTLAAAEVRDRLQRARLQWPDDVDRFFTWKEDGGNAPLAFFQMLTPEKNAEWDFLLDDVVRTRLEGVDGVGRIDIWGLREETIRVFFDRDKLRAHNVEYRELLERMGGDNFTEPIGEVESSGERLLVRVDGRFRTENEIREYPVRPGLKVGDIARVIQATSLRNDVSRYNGKATYTGIVRAAADANPVAAMDALRAMTETLQEDPRLEGLTFRFLFDQGAFIEDSLDTLLSTALQGGLLALLVLLLFLRNMRMTLSISISIPLTLLFVGGYLFFTDGSLNIASMAGMTLAVGMVVDNAVVVLENIRRLRHEGVPLREACVRGSREVGLAVSMATLTTIVVFLPMVFMSGERQARVMFAGVGIPLATALLASLFVALLVLPAMVRMVERNSTASAMVAATPGRWSPVRWLQAFAIAPTRLALKFPVAGFIATVLAFVAMMVVTASLMSTLDVKAGGGGPFRRGDIGINVSFPRGMSLERANEEMSFYEKFVAKRKDEWQVKSVGSRFSRDGGRIDVTLLPEVTAEETREINSKILAAWPERAGVKIRLRARGGGMGGADRSDEDDDRNFVVRLFGRDNDYLMNLAEKARAAIEGLPATETIEVPAMDREQEILVDVSRERLQNLGVRPESLLGAMASGLQGRELTRFNERGKEVRLIAQFDGRRTYGDDAPPDNPTLADLRSTQVFANAGTFQNLEDLSEIRFRRTVSEIETMDGRTSVVLVGRRAEGIGAKEMSADLKHVMDRIPMSRGYTWSEVSPSQDTNAELAALLDAALLAVVLIFLLMGILFESLIRPLAILLVTGPLAMFGAVTSLAVFHGSIDPMGMIGIIILLGVVVNNGIVLLDYVERLRRQGVPRNEAILEGVRVRLRPIFMTASTTVVGLLPMAVFGESSSDGLSYVGLSIAVAGGLALCTLLTPIAVPLAYGFFDFVSVALWGSVRRANGWRRTLRR